MDIARLLGNGYPIILRIYRHVVQYPRLSVMTLERLTAGTGYKVVCNLSRYPRVVFTIFYRIVQVLVTDTTDLEIYYKL
jgi:hypothetical protein